MKSFINIFLLFLGFATYAQQQDLTSNVWYLTEININGNDITIPQNSELPQVTFECSSRFRPIACNAGDAIISSISNNMIEAGNDWGRTLGSCNDTQNNNFDILYLRTFFSENITFPFSYTISNGSNGILIMTLTANNQDFAVYQNQPLSTANINELSDIKLYPNPVKEQLHIESNLSIAKAYLYDITGKQTKTYLSNQLSQPVDMSSLQPGVYFITLYSDSGQQTTKKIIIE